MGTVEVGSHARGVHEGVSRMSDMKPVHPEPLGDFVDFVTAGVHVKGEFHCADCGYGVTVYRELPRCPMCGGREWEQSDWSPFSASLRALRR